MSITIALAPSNQFVDRCNVACLLIAVAITLLLAKYTLSTLSYILLISLTVMCIFLLKGRRQDTITHLILHEGDVGAGVHRINDEYELLAVLCEVQCRHNQLGCWLAFQKTPSNELSLWARQKKMHWVFLPKFLLSPSQYKSICRHLIWHVS
ncbi:hypothetical protein GPUN_0301 [Glaciecola punicea ACAM 611]|uniref:Uncharacterized protein n=1 Tax=Glaciecola punicea ACAM 611 TaxID=1121923 RepID=H5T822_9ALTE|nr:hypothetical protein [Glaciecola punicea]GAB54449.1 hypothetical protein GPUN_0301 [Glaciecola punicea ACAM 611]